MHFNFLAANFCPHKDDDDCPSSCYNYKNDELHSKIDESVDNSRITCPLGCPNCGGGWPACELNLYKDIVTNRTCDIFPDASLCFHKVRIKVDFYPRSLLLGFVKMCVIQKRRLVNYFCSLLDNILPVFVLYKRRGDQIFLIEIEIKKPKLKFLKMYF